MRAGHEGHTLELGVWLLGVEGGGDRRMEEIVNPKGS